MAKAGYVEKTKKIVKSMERQHKPPRWAKPMAARPMKKAGRGR